MIVGQGPISLAVGVGRGCLDIFWIFFLSSVFSPLFFLPLWETYRISTLSEVFIQWKDLHVRIETPTARRCFDTHKKVFPLDGHRGQGRYPAYTPNSNIDSKCVQNGVADQM